MSGGSSALSKIRKDFLLGLAKQGKRHDERAFDQYRPLQLNVGLISKAEGSAEVRLGNSRVVVGIKMQTGEPYPDSPNDGTMTTSAEMRPIASPDFEAGPPNPESIEMARVVDRGIREAKLIQMDKLCITPGEKIWMSYIDMHIIDYDGNLFDACSYAAVAALLTTKVPVVEKKVGTKDVKLPVSESLPIACTTAKLGDALLADPNFEEEQVMDVRLTVALDEENNVRAMQKGLGGSFKVQEVKDIIAMTQTNSRDIRAQIRKVADEYWAGKGRELLAAAR